MNQINDRAEGMKPPLNIETRAGPGRWRTIVIPVREPIAGVARPHPGDMMRASTGAGERRITMAASVLLHIYASETNRRSRGDALQNAGFYVIENAGGEAAMALATAHNPALILLDLKLPNRDGYEVCRDLKRSEDTANVPVLAISPVGDGEDEYAKALESGASAYLRDPVAPAVLVSTVRALIRARQTVFVTTADPEKEPDPHSCQAFGNVDVILDNLIEALVVLDSSARITYLNAAAARLLSQRADALVGKDVGRRIQMPSARRFIASTLKRFGIRHLFTPRSFG